MSNVECRMGRLIVGVILLASAKVADAQLTRACCLPNATCAVREPQVCIAQGGVIDSHHTTCAGVVCTGACCLPDGRCVVVIPQSCIAASGTFDSLGSLCDDVVCGGACCRANGSCALSNEASCTSPNTFQGLGSDCGTVDCKGACCLRDGSCEETGEPGCQSDNGVFQGLSAACAETDCAGACCLPDGSCAENSQPGCVQDQSGEFLGLAAACGDAVCTGACCLADKTCVQTGPGRCAQFGGVYQGRESNCGDECPVAMPKAFTYQGQLKRAGVPMNGPIDARFSLWLNSTGQSPEHQIGSALALDSVEVANGLFNVELDFGQNALNGNARWLQVEIHDHADPPGTFTTLSPRQALIPTPYALQTRGIVVLDNGNVGIGTKTPSGPLTVHASGAGFLHEDGTHQLTTKLDGSGAAIGTISDHPLSFFTSDDLPAITIDTSRRVGIDTTSPAAKLDVRGDIKLGSSGELFAVASAQNLRIIAGEFDSDGNESASDFSVSHSFTGAYSVFFDPPFSGSPVVTATCHDSVAAYPYLFNVTRSGMTISVSAPLNFVSVDNATYFIAIGPR